MHSGTLRAPGPPHARPLARDALLSQCGSGWPRPVASVDISQLRGSHVVRLADAHRRRWFGRLGLLGVATQGNPGTDFAAIGGGAGYVLAAPAIHIAHGQPVRALISLGMRLALPVVGAYVGAAVASVASSTSCHGCDYKAAAEQYDVAQLFGTIDGALIGALIAMAVDATALSWKSPDERAPPRPAPGLLTLPSVPAVGVAYDSDHQARPTLGIAGSF